MRGYRLTPDDRIRREVISKLLCHGVIRKAEIETDFAIAFDDYFAVENRQLEPLAADGLIESRLEENPRNPAGPHLHPQRGHDFRSLPGRTKNGREAAILENAVRHDTPTSRSHDHHLPQRRSHRRRHFRSSLRMASAAKTESA